MTFLHPDEGYCGSILEMKLELLKGGDEQIITSAKPS